MTKLSAKEYRRLTNWAGTDKKGRLKASQKDIDYIKGKSGQKQELTGRNAVRQTKQRKEAVKAGFRSNFEKRIAEKLSKANIPFEYETEKLKYTIKPNVACECQECGSSDVLEQHEYLPDFVLKELYIEAKGEFTAKDRKKMIAVTKQNHKKPILIVFQSNNKLSAKSKTTYMDWCKKNNIPACEHKHMISNIIAINNICIT